jgi:hypothetical protein
VGCKANLLLSLLVNEGNLTCNNHWWWWWWWWLTTHMHALWVDNGNIGLHIGIGTHQTHYGTGLATFLVRTSPSDQAQVTKLKWPFSIDHDIRLGYRSFFVMGKMVQIVNKFEQNISKQLKQLNNVNASSTSWQQFPGGRGGHKSVNKLTKLTHMTPIWHIFGVSKEMLSVGSYGSTIHVYSGYNKGCVIHIVALPFTLKKYIN